MILLPAQFQLLFYHLIAGWLTGFSYQFEHCLKNHLKQTWLRNVMDWIWATLCFLVFYYGLFRLNGGVTQIYCLAFFCLGFFIYLQFYFNAMRVLTAPLDAMFMRFSLVFSRFFCIIKMRKKRRALFDSNSKKKDKAKKNQRFRPESD